MLTLAGLRLHYDTYLSPEACASGKPGTGLDHMTDLDRAAEIVATEPPDGWLDYPECMASYIRQAVANSNE